MKYMKELLQELGFKADKSEQLYKLKRVVDNKGTFLGIEGGSLVYYMNESVLYISSGQGLDYDYAYSIQILNTEEGRDKLRKIVELLTK